MSDLNRNAPVEWSLRAYVLLTFVFVFAPIAASFVFSFNVDRFPLCRSGFSLTGTSRSPRTLAGLAKLRNTLIVGVTVSIPRHRARFRRGLHRLPLQVLRQVALPRLALLPPTIRGHSRPRRWRFSPMSAYRVASNR